MTTGKTVAIIGYGFIGESHHKAYLQHSRLLVTDVVDTTTARLDIATANDPGIRTHHTAESFFDVQDVDIVDICTPPSLHLGLIKQALKAKLHVLCEKPFLLSTSEFRTLLQVLGKRNSLIYPSHNYKFSPMMIFLRNQTLGDNALRLKHGYFKTLRKGHAKGTPEWYADWRRDRRFSGGGILFDHGPHSIYLATNLTGTNPVEVSCISGNFSHDEFTSTEDTVILEVQFPDDVMLRLDLSWAAGFRSTRYALIGDATNVLVENDMAIITKDGISEKVEIRSDFDDASHVAWFSAMFDDMLGHLDTRQAQTALLEEAWYTCAVIEAAVQSSARNGQPQPVLPFPVDN